MLIFADHTATNDFWEEAAEKFKLIGHDRNWKNSEAAENHFSRIVDSARNPFDPVYYIDEVLEQAADSLKYPLLITESTKEDLQKTNNKYSRFTGALIMVNAAGEQGDFDSQHAAITSAEHMLAQLLAYLLEYFKTNNDQGKVVFEECRIHKLGPLIDGHFGARLDYTIQINTTLNRFCIVPEEWN